MSQLPALIWVFAYLSLLTVGGGLAAFPELKTLTVETYHWLTLQQLIHLYSLGQVAPGPNMMMVAAVGEQVAGVMGAVVVVIAFFGPTGLLTLWTGRLWLRLERWRWRSSIQRGLAPVSIGLLAAGAVSLAKGALTGWIGVIIAVVVFALLLGTRINPAFLVLCGAVAGLFVFGSR
ncbi:MAG TPA: chromate transporter [Candidatus Eisenbacteria bacterium]|nr:chromate transporter [Candidatus Eisenbacteria bacterium]